MYQLPGRDHSQTHNESYRAERFAIYADKTVLVETTNFSNALVVLVELFFVLDPEYPAMPHTFEFLERSVK